MSATLIIGYGNPDRADDGVAYHVVNSLRRRLGREPLQPGETGLETLGNQVDTVLLQQLVPELMETAAAYDCIVFVDAHVPGVGDEELLFTPVNPEYSLSSFTHHVTPAAFLALIEALYSRKPAGHLLSIQGHNFDFLPELSPGTRKLIEPAVLRIWGFVGSQEEIGPDPKVS